MPSTIQNWLFEILYLDGHYIQLLKENQTIQQPDRFEYLTNNF
jgi:hypothetical protein